jgi:hypothetical protein
MRAADLRIMVLVACMLAGAGGVSAQGDRPGRYTMSPAEGGGFARLDTETGQMALCLRRDGDWSCREMAEPGRGLNQEVERLRTENQRLKAELRQLEDIALGDRRADAGPKGDRRGLEFKLPSEKDVDDAMGYVQRMLKKFREKMREVEGDQRAAPL